jgi:thiol:disulfide interchange protein DsbC
MNRLLASLCCAPALLLACVSATAQILDAPPAIKAAVQAMMPDTAPSWLKPAPIAGMWEVAFGPNILYISEDGQHLLRGDILKIDGFENVSRAARNRARLDVVDGMGHANLIVFTPKNFQHTVTVFTDVDCGYCAKLHNEMQTYLDAGIRIRYAAFPRAGIGSESYRKMVAVWCSDDQQAAITMSKAGQDVAAKTCSNPVADQLEVGQLVGVRGTPTIVLETGDLVPGYLPASRLLQTILEAKTKG